MVTIHGKGAMAKAYQIPLWATIFHQHVDDLPTSMRQLLIMFAVRSILAILEYCDILSEVVASHSFKRLVLESCLTVDKRARKNESGNFRSSGLSLSRLRTPLAGQAPRPKRSSVEIQPKKV